MDSKSKIKSLLEKLLDEHFLGADNTHPIEFKVDALVSEIVDARALSRIIEHLKDKGLITESRFWRGEDAEYEHEPDYDFYNISFPKDFRATAAEYITELGGTTQKGDVGTVVYLEKGILWHGNRDEFFYTLETESKGLKILTYLVDNKGYQSTKSIAAFLGVEDEQAVRVLIGKLKEKIKAKLKIDDLFNSSKNDGYQINPAYKVAKS
jgi:hypothetical protein